jgi:hypothetical protein
MFEKYSNTRSSRGSLAEVWIDTEKKLVKKYYKVNALTIKNRPAYHRTIEDITNLYNNEIKWSTQLKSKHVVEILEYGELTDSEGFYILQEYSGPDLLQYDNNDLPKIFPNIQDQLEEMYILFKEHNVYKLNNAKCNLTGSNGVLKCFDFKYAVVRESKYIPIEIRSLTKWISNIDKSLVDRLSKYIL